MNIIEKGVYWRSKRLRAFYNIKSLDSPLLHAARIKYIISDLPVKNKKYKNVYSGDMNIYENPDIYPEAWIAPHAQFVKSEAEAAAAISSAGFDPSKTAVIEVGGREKPSLVSGTGGAIEVTEYSPERIIVNLTKGSSGWLIFTNTWYPDWTVEVGGWPRKLWKSDLAFMAVEIKPGDRVVEFKYLDHVFTMGLFITIAGMGVCLLIWMMSLRNVKRDA
jgi:hypothetical protein